MGRVTSVVRLMSYSGPALGALLGGLLADTLGLRPPFLVAGALFAAATVTALLALPRFRAWERPREDSASAEAETVRDGQPTHVHGKDSGPY